jgi:hypothetical protein
VIVFGASSTEPPVEQLTVQGTITNDGAPAADVPVVAYGTETRTDSNGRYSMSLQARGSLRVAVLTPQPADGVIVLDGRRTYDLDIEVVEECPEGCE